MASPHNNQSLYQSNQLKVIQYVRAHHLQISKCFDELCPPDLQSPRIKVERVFDYLKSAFSLDGFQFETLPQHSPFFVENNREKMEQLLHRFYTQAKGLAPEQFLFYRTTISQQEVADLIEFWIKNYDDVFVNYKIPSSQDANQFIGRSDVPIEKQIQDLLDEIRKYELTLETLHTPAEKARVEEKISNLRKQVESTLMMQESKYENTQPKSSPSLGVHEEASPTHSEGHKTIESNSNKKKGFTVEEYELPVEISSSLSKASNISVQTRKLLLKAIFEHYSKQRHVVGTNVSFEKIEEQTTTMNYIKIAHFLKDFGVKTKDKQQPFRIFQKAAANLRSLQLNEFEEFLKLLARHNEEEGLEYALKEERFFNRLFASEAGKSFRSKIKNRGIAFESRESHDFRIKPEEIRYEFRLSPHSGKLSSEIMDELEHRKNEKLQQKLEVQRQKDIINQKFLKKLSSIDPFSASLVHLKETPPKPEQGTVALNNLQVLRDVSFNPKEYFKISDDDGEDPFLSEYSLKSHNRNSTERRQQKSPVTSPSKNQRSDKTQAASSSSESPSTGRRARTMSIAEEVSARAQEVGRMQEARQESIIKNLAAQNSRKVELGLGAVRKSGNYGNSSSLNGSVLSTNNGEGVSLGSRRMV